MRLVTFAGEIYHSFQNACRVIQRSGSVKSYGILSQFVCSHSTSKHLAAWIWSSKKYYSVKPFELPVFASRHKEHVQLFGEVFWFANISRSVRECRELIFFQCPFILQSFFREIPFNVRGSSSELKESSSELKQSSLELKESSLELESTLDISKERSPNLTKSSEHRERLPDFFERGFEKETTLLIPTTPSLKALEEKCGTINDQKLCIEIGKLMETTSQSFRLTARNISRYPVCKQNFRDREPSRVPVKTFFQVLNKRKLRRNAKRVIKHSTPTSSNLHWLATDFKLWYVSFLHRCECFFSQFLYFRKKQLRFNAMASYCHPIEINTFCCNNLKSEPYCSSKRKLLLSNDVEVNPGPDNDKRNQVALTFVPDPLCLLEQRLYLLGMRPLDVGGAGDCLFRAVSHQ